MVQFGTSNAILTVNLSALEKNYRLLQKQVGAPVTVAGIIKADGYGLGAKPVCETLKNNGCKNFFVATLDEALAIRQFNTDNTLAVFGGLMQGCEDIYHEHNILPVLNSPIDIENWSNYAQKHGQKLDAMLHFDTGMNRLGLSHGEWLAIKENGCLDALNIVTILSHFASADDQDQTLTKNQAKRFAKIAQDFPKAQISLANSSGIFRDAIYHYDMVRPGYALYGGNPTPETINPMQNVVSLEARILQIRDCKKGDTIGYGASHIFKENTHTATVALGYDDGFFRATNKNAKLYYKSQPCPVIGRVSMDAVTIDISHLIDKSPKQGEAVEILGDNQTIDDLARSAATIGYEILTSLGTRYKRIYI